MVDIFDSYAKEYREIVNRVSRISGENYEFFIRFRISRMKRKLITAGVFQEIRRVLDLGCGIGAAEKILEDEFPGAVIAGVDSSCESVAEAGRQVLSRTQFFLSSAEALPVKDKGIDLVYSNGLFHHIPPQQRVMVLRELSRVVRPGGQIFIFENNPANPLMMRAMKDNPFDINARAVAPRELSGLAECHGFKLLQIAYYFFFPRCLRIFRRSEHLLEWLPFGAQYFIWAMREP